jgi:hypothetical protein
MTNGSSGVLRTNPLGSVSDTPATGMSIGAASAALAAEATSPVIIAIA